MRALGALLLAAGGSTRMGRQKLLLAWGEQTVIGASLDAILDAPVEWIGLVTGMLGASVGRRARQTYRVRPEEEKPFFRVIHNPAWEHGMRGSIVLGLEHVPPHLDGLFIALGDMPAIPASVYQRLAEAFASDPQRIYRPVYRGRPGHPVLFPRELLDGVSPTGDEGLKSILQAHQARVRLIEVDEPGVTLDIDTPEAYRLALYLRQQRKPPPGLQAAAAQLEQDE